MADTKGLGKAFIDSLIAAVPAEQQDAVRAGLEANDAALTLAGAREAELTQWHGELDTWAKTKGPQAPAVTTPALQTPATAVTGISKDDATKLARDIVQQELIGAAGYMDAAIGLGIDHFKEFGDKLDIAALRSDPDVARVGILGVYDKIHGPKLREKRDAATAAAAVAREAEIRADERRKVAKEGNTNPYPGRTPSVLDAINPEKKPGALSVDDIADAYDVEVQRLEAGGTPLHSTPS